MLVNTLPSAVTPEDFFHQHGESVTALDSKISYLCLPPMPEEDLRHYIQDTVAAMPPVVRSQLPPITIFLVPYLERQDLDGPIRVSFEPVPMERSETVYRLRESGRTILYFATKDEEVSEFHYSLYHQLAELLTVNWQKDAATLFSSLVKEEVAAKVHGEVDEKSWQLKQNWQSRAPGKEGKAFRDYVRQAFVDTMTLYLHGICCDIDVETGPRQMPSRSVRKRLEALHTLYPPPAGHAVFPEQLNKLRPGR